MASARAAVARDVPAKLVQRILHLDSNATIQSELKQAIEREGYLLIHLSDLNAACQLISAHPPDLIIVEQSASFSLGASQLERAREEHGPIPLIVVGREEESDELVALALGADDYVPHGRTNRLLARIKAALRRQRGRSEVQGPLQIGPITLDQSRYQAEVDGQEIYLTVSEFKLLREIVSANGRVVHREFLLSRIFGVSGEIESRRIDVHIAGLRRKLGSAADWLQTVRTLGYVWRAPM